MSGRANVAIIGSGNIGTDLMIKILKMADNLDLSVMVGIDPESDGLKRAAGLGVQITSAGIDGLRKMDVWNDIDIVFDATSAKAHAYHSEVTTKAGKVMVDLTPASIGPYVVPVVNGDENLDQSNVNMVTCGGQATIPIVAAVSSVANVHYAEIIASISSKSAGPGTRANIDEFTETTSAGITKVGGAEKGKAIIILNPAEPPMIMRDTVFTLSSGADERGIEASILKMIERVQKYVPGYRLKQNIQFERFGANNPIHIPGHGTFEGIKTTDLAPQRPELKVDLMHEYRVYANRVGILELPEGYQVERAIARNMFGKLWQYYWGWIILGLIAVLAGVIGFVIAGRALWRRLK